MNSNTEIYYKAILDNQPKLALQAEADKSCHQPISRTFLEQIKESIENTYKNRAIKQFNSVKAQAILSILSGDQTSHEVLRRAQTCVRRLG